MKSYLSVFTLLSAVLCNAQQTNWTKLTINPQLKIDTSFNQKWSYTWYVIKHPDGHFENTISDTITAEDTLHHYYTAACTNTHNGSHEINYCNAATYNDDVELHFSGQPPGYNEELVITIRKNLFSGSYNFSYLAREKYKEVKFQILSQKLVLKKRPVWDSMLTGTIEARFREKVRHLPKPSNKKRPGKATVTYSKIYLLRGRFHTRLNHEISIE